MNLLFIQNENGTQEVAEVAAVQTEAVAEEAATTEQPAAEVAEATPEDKPAILVNVWSAYTCEFTESTGGKGKAVKRCYDLTFRDWYWDAFKKSEAGELPEGQRL